jgi:diguanylate cyclase
MRMRSDSERLHKSLEETRSEVERLDAQLDQARRLALIDALTGLANRRAFDIELDRLLHAHQSKRRPFALILLDVDHFKLVNDRHGHVIGDKVLQQLANRLKSRTRQGDTVARYGGEEFAILLPRTGLAEAKNVADQACDHIRKLNLRRTDTGETIENVTASFGVAEASHEATANDVIHRADQALYEAKRRGRNRVVAAPCPINA